jgi:hypothetical protein
LIAEALASRPAQLKNGPAQNLEMKDFSPAVGMMPLMIWRVFGTTRWRLPSGYINSLLCGRGSGCANDHWK